MMFLAKTLARTVACAVAASLLASLPAHAGSRSFTAGAQVQLVGDYYYDDDDDDIDCSWPRDSYERRQCDRWRDRQDRHDRRKRDKDTEAAIGLGILGLAVGAIVAGSIAEQNAKERRRDQWGGPCHRRYGYDRRSNTFIGEGGRRFYCR
ncbi:hypothetical protein ACHMW7_21575 [Aminobacter sp. UC22_36]|uniref:hypothetical protein n=1 Tax=Aminobacter sp. UC22_36 TaxID=3374549 RepID=UPI00375775C9